MIQIGAFLKTTIYLISASLFYPTLVLLVLAFFWVVLFAGTFFAEWLERARLERCPPEKLPHLLVNGGGDRALTHRVRKFRQRLTALLESGDISELAIENLIQETTLGIWKAMDRLRILVRLAPSLGLIGTLIPMGTGLAALGQGDLTRLSSDLVIAFTTTVVGIFIGMAAFFFYTVKRRWIEEDIKNLELAAELMTQEQEGDRS